MFDKLQFVVCHGYHSDSQVFDKLKLIGLSRTKHKIRFIAVGQRNFAEAIGGANISFKVLGNLVHLLR